jgi:hypothetical protein
MQEAQTGKNVDSAGCPSPGLKFAAGHGGLLAIGAMHRELLESVSDFSRRGLRVIAFSYRDLAELPKLKKSAEEEEAEAEEERKEAEGKPFSLVAESAAVVAPAATAESGAAAVSVPEEDEEEAAAPITDAVLIGMVGLSDPLRPTSYRSVRLCQRAGIIVRMVTGTSLAAAAPHAQTCGCGCVCAECCMLLADSGYVVDDLFCFGCFDSVVVL